MFVDGGGALGLRCGCCGCCWGALTDGELKEGSSDDGGGGSIGREAVNMMGDALGDFERLIEGGGRAREDDSSA